MSARFFCVLFFAPVFFASFFCACPAIYTRAEKPRKVKKIALDKTQSGIALI